MARQKAHRRPRGSGAVYADAKGYYSYTIELPPDPETGKRRRKTIRSKDPRKAKLKYQKVRQEYIANGAIKTAKTPALKDWLDRWLEEYKRPHIKPRVYETYRSDCRLISSSIGAIRIADLDATHIRKLERDITATRSSKTALNAYRRLSSSLSDAQGEGLISDNICDHCPPPRVEPNPTAILEQGQPEQLIKAAGESTELPRRRGQRKWPDTEDDKRMWQLMWRVAFETGMRQGERFALTPSDLVMSDSVPGIHVRHELQRYSKDTIIPAWLKAKQIDDGIWMVPPKSHKGERFVPVSQQLWDDLRSWVDSHGVGTDELIFTRKGHPLTNPVERRRWYRSLEAAGLPKVTMRSARHYFATQLARAGASEDARRAIMGHVDIATTAGYTHWDAKALGELTGKTVIDIDPVG